MSAITNNSYASTWDADLPQEVSSRLKVDKRLRRSVVMKSSFLSHTWTLMQRCWLLTTRDIFLMSIRILGFLLVALGIVQIFAHALDGGEHICPRYESQVEDMASYLISVRGRMENIFPMLKQMSSQHMFFFHIILCITIVTAALAGLMFPLQMRMFIREYKNGWYSPASFIASQTLAELPLDMIGPLITVLVAYPLCNQPDSMYYWREIGYCIALIMTAIIVKSQAQICGAFLMDSVEMSVFMSCVAVMPAALLSGVPLRIYKMLPVVQWISYSSFMRYSFESLLSLRYGYEMCPCNPELIDGYPVGATATVIPPQLDRLTNGLLDLNLPANQTSDLIQPDSASAEHANLFLRYIRLVSDASNLYVPHLEELGDCKTYKSLFLMDMEVPNGILPKWFTIMAIMFVVSRILTYFSVKTVIKLRRDLN